MVSPSETTMSISGIHRNNDLSSGRVKKVILEAPRSLISVQYRTKFMWSPRPCSPITTIDFPVSSAVPSHTRSAPIVSMRLCRPSLRSYLWKPSCHLPFAEASHSECNADFPGRVSRNQSASIPGFRSLIIFLHR